MKNFIYHTTLVSIFSEAFVTHVVFDVKLFYLLIILNFVLLAFLGRITFSKKAILVYGIMLIAGIFSIIFGNNKTLNFLSQFLGILFVSSYYYLFFSFIKGKKIFSTYVNYSFAVAAIGLLAFVIALLFYKKVVPIKSIMLEPAHFATIILPAFFYSAKINGFKSIKTIVIFLGIILSGSSLGLLGLMVSLVLFPQKINIVRTSLAGVLLLLIATFSYFVYQPLKLRIDDTFKSFYTGSLQGANLSTYAFVSNFYVAVRSFQSNPISGGGLGSHELSHQRYIGSLTGVEEFDQYIHLNSKDANSLFLRILSELGIIGVIGVIFFIKKNYISSSQHSFVGAQELTIIARAILIYFFCKLLREGHYFSPEMYFFTILYFVNHVQFKRLRYAKIH